MKRSIILYFHVFKKKTGSRYEQSKSKVDVCLNVIMYRIYIDAAERVWLKASYSVPSLAISSSQILVSSSISWFCERKREEECLDIGCKATNGRTETQFCPDTIKVYAEI